jgi:hypothetical protein
MKLVITAIVLFVTLCVNAQAVLTPNSKVVDKKWIANTSYQMSLYALKDTMKFEIGKTSTSIQIVNNKIIVVTGISTKQAQSLWVDSTIANAKDLSPVYHSSYNMKRDMVLQFGKIVKGFYNDKIKHSNTIINDTTKQDYFDSNLYPVLITWLPLQEGYTKDISIYDYKPGGKTGVIKATVHNVTKGTFATQKSGIRDVWIVKVSDEIGGEGYSTYYIDAADRRLWKQQIEAGGRNMQMELIEE